MSNPVAIRYMWTFKGVTRTISFISSFIDILITTTIGKVKIWKTAVIKCLVPALIYDFLIKIEVKKWLEFGYCIFSFTNVATTTLLQRYFVATLMKMLDAAALEAILF